MTNASQSLISEERLAAAVDWCFRRRRPDWGFVEAEWRQLTRAYLDKLEPLARRQSSVTISYSDLVSGTDVAQHEVWWHVISDMLEVLVKACVDEGLPLITALVTYTDQPHPGKGFFDAAKRFGRQPAGQDDDTFWIAELGRVRERWSERVSKTN